MANLTNYVCYTEQVAREDCMETYHRYKTVFHHLKYDSETDSFNLYIDGKKYVFDYEVEKDIVLGIICRTVYLKEQEYGTILNNEGHISENLKDFIYNYKKDRFKQCLPLRFLRTLLQTFFFKPVGWLKANLGMDEL